MVKCALNLIITFDTLIKVQENFFMWVVAVLINQLLVIINLLVLIFSNAIAKLELLMELFSLSYWLFMTFVVY